MKGHGRVSFSWGLAIVWDYFSAPADLISGRFLVTLPLTLNLTLNVTLKNKMKFIFLFSVINLTLDEVWRKYESVAEYEAECRVPTEYGKLNSRTFPGYSRIKTIIFPGLWPEYLKCFSKTNSFFWPHPPLTASQLHPFYYTVQSSSVRLQYIYATGPPASSTDR